MGSKTSKLPYESNKEYDWKMTPDTADITAFRNFQPQADPSQGFRFARQRQGFLNTFQNPLGSYTTPELREQVTRSGLEEIGQNEQQVMRESQFDLNRLKMGQLGDLASLTRPQLVNTKETGYQTNAKQGGGFFSSLLGGAAKVGAAFI